MCVEWDFKWRYECFVISFMFFFKFFRLDFVICNFIVYRNVWFYLKYMLKVLIEMNVIVYYVKDWSKVSCYEIRKNDNSVYVCIYKKFE